MTTKNACNKNMSFEECEFALLNQAIHLAEKEQAKTLITNEVITIIDILKQFLIRKKLICYGGIAINNILPKNVQFYDDTEIPDFDFYSKQALDDVKELADIYYKRGFIEVEAKSGVHYGTFKLFVNFIPVADITQLNTVIFDELFKESIVVDNIHYSSPNFLRMGMFLELSRPRGDITRWEKVFSRLLLLNEYYPLETTNKNTECVVDVININESVFDIIFGFFVKQDVVFMGGYAFELYHSVDNGKNTKNIKKPLDVLTEDVETMGEALETLLLKKNIQVFTRKTESVEELVPENVEIVAKENNQVLATLHKPIACHSYNEIVTKNHKIKIASIDTILSFYLALVYVKSETYEKEKLVCMASTLFDIEERNHTSKKSIFKRFSIDCYGKQKTLMDIRSEKGEKFKEFSRLRQRKKKIDRAEYNTWFLRYRPDESKSTVKKRAKQSVKKSVKRTTIKKR